VNGEPEDGQERSGLPSARSPMSPTTAPLEVAEADAVGVPNAPEVGYGGSVGRSRPQ